jgi:hypothetical protein
MRTSNPANLAAALSILLAGGCEHGEPDQSYA